MTDAAKTQSTKADATADAMAEIPASLRAMTEHGIDQAKTAYEQIKTSTQDAVAALDGSADALKTGSTAFNTKTIEFTQLNMNAGFEFVRQLAGAKDVKEVVELQSAFARDQFAAYSSQAKDLGELSTKVAEHTSKPFAEGVQKSFEQAKQIFPAV